jgi:nicotinamidase-related amidase
MTTPDTALIIIDVQEEYFSGGLPVEFPPRDVSLGRIGAAMDAATADGTPVVVIRQNGPDHLFTPGTALWELRPEVADRHHDVLFDKVLPGAFTGTGLEAWLAERGITHVTIAGYMTNVCCDTTARQALHLGLGVTLLHDATGVSIQPGVDGAPIAAEQLHHATLAALAMIRIDLATTQEWIGRHRSMAA